MKEVVNLIIPPEGIQKLVRALVMLHDGKLPEVKIEAHNQQTEVRITLDINSVDFILP